MLIYLLERLESTFILLRGGQFHCEILDLLKTFSAISLREYLEIEYLHELAYKYIINLVVV